MAVTTTQNINLVEQLNFVDPRLPIARYRAFGTASGDVSGGSVEIIIAIRNSTGPFEPPGGIWNVELLAPRQLDTTVGQVGIKVVSFGRLVGGSSPLVHYAMQMIADVTWSRSVPIGTSLGGIVKALQESRFRIRNLEDNANTVTSISAEFNVNTNLDSYEFYVEGYFWRRDVFSHGYPLRPEQIYILEPPLK